MDTMLWTRAALSADAGMPIPPGMDYPYKPRVEADPNIFKPQHGVQLTDCV